MYIIVKYIIKSIMEKKARTILIIFSIALSGALYFASLSISNTLVEIYTQQARVSTGNADIIIYANEQSPSQFVSLIPLTSVKDQVTYGIPLIQANGLWKESSAENVELGLVGIDLDKYRNISTLTLKDNAQVDNLVENQIIICERMAEKYNLNVGDTIEVKIQDSKRRLTIEAISENVGFFASAEGANKVLMSYVGLSRYMETNMLPTQIYIKILKGEEIQATIDTLQEKYPKYAVEEAVDTQVLKEKTSWLEMPLLLMTVIVTLMGIFIIYSSFKTVMVEKLPTIGTFRSVGASKKMMTKVLLVESLVYGIIGGVLAGVFGVLILKAIVSFIVGDSSDIRIDKLQLIISGVIGITISIFSSILPILNVSKINIKEIVLDNHSIRKKKRTREVIGIICILISIIVSHISTRDTMLLTGIIGILTGIIGGGCIIPIVVKLLVGIMDKLGARGIGGINILSLKNVRDSKSMINNITLICISIGIMMMVNNLAIDLGHYLTSLYEKNFMYDIEVRVDELDKNTANSFVYYEGVKGVYPNYKVYSVKVSEFNNHTIDFIQNVSGMNYDEYIKLQYKSEEDKQRILGAIQSNRYIAVSNVLKNRYDLQEGDVITLKLSQGERKYTVIGFFDCMITNGGYAIIGDNFFRLDTGAKEYKSVYLNVQGNPEQLLHKIKEDYKDRNVIVQTKQEIQEADEAYSSQLVMLLSGFSILAMVIGSIGIINNLLINFMQRKKQIAILRSVGMSKKQVKKMIFLEAFYCGVISSIGGSIIGYLTMNNIPDILEGMEMAMDTSFDIGQIGGYSICVIIGIIIVSLSSIRKSSKLSIIQEIKYE